MLPRVGPFTVDFLSTERFEIAVKEMIAAGREDLMPALDGELQRLPSVRRGQLQGLVTNLKAQDRARIPMERTGGRIDYDKQPTFIEYDYVPDTRKAMSIRSQIFRNPNIRIHGKSVSAFQAGQIGNAFTGLVHMFHPDIQSPNNAPKMYLFPVNPMGGAKEYKSRMHDPATVAQVYEAAPQGAIVHHDPNLDPLKAMSHIRLREMIEDSIGTTGVLKHQKWGGGGRQMRQLYNIGFTVIKVEAGAHRFGWASTSQNHRAFEVSSDYGRVYNIDIRTPPRDWAEAIVRAVDAIDLG